MMKLNLFINATETESYIDIHAPKRMITFKVLLMQSMI